QRIDVVVRRLDAGIKRRELAKDALPKRMSLLHGVALVGHADFGQASLGCELERVSDDPVNPLPRVQLLLDRNLVFGAGLEPPANADVETLRVLTKHKEVHVGRPASLQRTQPLVEESDRAIVDVEIQLEAGPEQNVASVPVVGHAGITECPDEDRIEL